MVQPLALDVAPAGQARGWRKHEDTIDALPYVDTLNDAEKARVDALIREEVCDISKGSVALVVLETYILLPVTCQTSKNSP